MTLSCAALQDVQKQDWDAIVLGAGPAGAITALQLAGRGTRTLLVDRKSFPRKKVCGACLNVSALQALRSAGLGNLAGDLGGTRLDKLELRFSGRSLRLGLPGGIALSRHRFDAALAGAAVASGATFLQRTEGMVGPVQAKSRRVMLVQEGQSVTALSSVVIVATGLGQARFEGADVVRSNPRAGSRIGAGCHVRMTPEFDREGTVFMAVGRQGYVGLVRLEDGGLNVAAAFDKKWLRDHGNPGAAACQVLTEAGFAPLPDLWDAAWQGTIPLSRRTWPIAGERYFVLGDAAGYVEPFTGEGMAWALRSGLDVIPLAERGIAGWDPSLPRAWQSIHRGHVMRRQRLSRGIRILLCQPWLVRAAFGMTTRVPAVAQFLIHRLNTADPLGKPS
jgi:flavin-dependent dehydrogenase